MVVFSRGRFFPDQEDMRASLSKWNSRDCPIVGANFTIPLMKLWLKRLLKEVIEW
jgi:hypothetical protein